MATNVNICPIWGGEHSARGVYYPRNRTYVIDESPRAGGGYQIDEVTLKASVLPLSADEKARLTTWLVEQRVQGVLRPEITETVIDYVRTKPPIPLHRRADGLLQFIAAQTRMVGDNVEVDRNGHEAYARSESINWQEIGYFLGYLIDNEWIRGVRYLGGGFLGMVTASGYRRIEEQQINTDYSQVFVAMWFDDSMDAAFENGIRPAIEDTGYRPLRIDRKEHVNKIDDEIIAELRRSRFIVADFTHGDDGARGGVYYEAGFAHGLDLPVIFTCQKDALKTLHFDTNHYSHIVWTEPAELREKLKNRILAVIGKGPSLHDTSRVD